MCFGTHPLTGGTSLADDVLVVQKGLALLLCDDATILEETLQAIDGLDLHIRRLGDRALLVPADQVEEILESLHNSGTFPRVVGHVPTSTPPDKLSTEEQAS